MDPYDRLLTLAKLEFELAVQEDFDGLERLDRERRGIVAVLPTQCPPAAKPIVVEMARIQSQTTAVLQEARTRVAGEMGRLERREETAKGYGRQATPQRGTFSAAA